MSQTSTCSNRLTSDHLIKPQYTYSDHIAWILRNKEHFPDLQVPKLRETGGFPQVARVGYEDAVSFLMDLFSPHSPTLQHEIPIVHDAYRFTLGVLAAISPSVSPIKQFMWYHKERPYTSEYAHLCKEAIEHDYVMQNLLDSFFYAYFFYAHEFLHNGNIMFASIPQLGADLHAGKSMFFSFASVLLEFDSKLKLPFPCLPCTVNIGATVSQDELEIISTHDGDNTYSCEALLNRELEPNMLISIPAILSPNINFPLIKTYTETCEAAYAGMDLPELNIQPHPSFMEQKDLDEYISKGQFHMWECPPMPPISREEYIPDTSLFSMQ